MLFTEFQAQAAALPPYSLNRAGKTALLRTCQIWSDRGDGVAHVRGFPLYQVRERIAQWRGAVPCKEYSVVLCHPNGKRYRVTGWEG